MVLIEYPEPYAVVRLSPEDEMPFWATRGRFTSITRAPGELSVICPEHSVPPTQHAERGWYLLGCDGPFREGLINAMLIANPVQNGFSGASDVRFWSEFW